MLKNFKYKIKNNLEILSLLFLVIITAILISFFNYKKNINTSKYNNFVNNIYLQKTLNHVIDNLEPKYKKFNHKIK